MKKKRRERENGGLEIRDNLYFSGINLWVHRAVGASGRAPNALCRQVPGKKRGGLSFPNSLAAGLRLPDVSRDFEPGRAQVPNSAGRPSERHGSADESHPFALTSHGLGRVCRRNKGLRRRPVEAAQDLQDAHALR